MLIALYQDHHHLPFWHVPKQPEALFDPEKHATLTFKNQTYKHEDDGTLAKDWWIWQILMGINAIEMPLVMAHVSAFCHCTGPDTFHSPHRVWVQFTTVPNKSTNGVPLVVKGEKVQVQHLWGSDNKTRSPYDFLPKEEQGGNDSKPAEFWKDFFEAKLREAKAEKVAKARAEAKLARARAKFYNAIP